MPPFSNRLMHRSCYALLVFVLLLTTCASLSTQAISGHLSSTPETGEISPDSVILAGLDGAAEKTVTIDDYANLYVPVCIRASNLDSRIAFIVDGQIYVTDIDRFQSPEAIPHGDLWANCVTWSNDDRSLYVLGSPTAGDRPVQIYHLPLEGDPTPDQLSFDHRGISSIKLSPDGTRLLFEFGDGRIHSDLQTLEARQRYEWRPPHVIDGLIFKRDGSGYQTTKAEKNIHVLDIQTKQPLQLTGTRHQDTDGTWSPDGKEIAFVRDVSGGSEYHSDLWIMSSKAKDGVAGTKLTKTPALRSAPAWSGDGEHIAYLWADPRHGPFAVIQLALYAIEDGTERVLTTALDRSVLSFRFSPDGQSLIFTYVDGGGQHLARLGIDGGKIERLIDGSRVVSGFDLTSDGNLVLKMKNNDDFWNVYALRGKREKQITSFNYSFFSDTRLGEKEKYSFDNQDGQRVEMFVTKPAGFDGSTKFPAVLRIHGGPVSQFTYGYDFFSQYLAANGYLVIEPNIHGSVGRGQEFTRAIHHNWGCTDYPEAVQAVDHVVSLGYVDPDRLAVTGYSYGGYLTNCIITRTTTKFKAAATGAGHSLIIANYGHDIWLRWYNWELGYPWESPQLYERLSPLLRAHYVQTPTLFLGGAKDWNVPILNAELFYQSLRVRNVPTELVVYPEADHIHWHYESSKDYYARIVRWFDKYVK
jgi:dipeptidyl aminopeptidase/acylaminoacyl peptidase